MLFSLWYLFRCFGVGLGIRNRDEVRFYKIAGRVALNPIADSIIQAICCNVRDFFQCLVRLAKMQLAGSVNVEALHGLQL